MDKTKLQVISGGKGEHEKTFLQLINHPETFERERFEHLVDNVYRDRLTFSDIWELMHRRVRSRPKSLEGSTLLAILERNDEEYERLMKLLDRRNKLGIDLIKNDSPGDSR